MGSQVNFQALGYPLQNVSLNVYADFRGMFTSLQQYLYLYIPLLTMGLMSRELSTGSIKLLYSSPVTNMQIIMGKYLSMVLYALILSGIMFLFVLYGAITIEHFDFPAVITGLLGLFLLICAYSAIGLFMSSLTSYQVVAAMGTFAILFVLNLIGTMWQNIELVRDITYWLSMSGRTREFLRGLICSEDLLYFIIVIALFLSFSVIRLNANRQKTPLWTVFLKFSAVLLIAVTLGYITSRPVFMAYYDSTKTKANTLTEKSQEIVSKLKGALTINSYVNILDNFYWIGLPYTELQDRDRFRQYTRFKPEIKMKYIHYYAKADNPGLDKRYPKLNDRQRMLEYAKSMNLDSNMYRSPEEIAKLENLKPENFRFVRTLVRESGEKSFLRVFDDAQVFPSEAEISVAMKKLVSDLPNVGFVTGHGERDCIKIGDRDYNKFAMEKSFRYSLVNQGFDFKMMKLDNPVPDDIDILVIADVRIPYSENDLKNLQDFIDKGGNLLIAGEPGREKILNPLVESLGVKFLPGTVVRTQENFLPDFIMSVPTKAGAEKMFRLDFIRSNGMVVTMPGLAPLEYEKNGKFKVTELFVADTSNTTWIETESKNFVDDTVKVNPGAGEKYLSDIPSVLALERSVPEKKKEQKIVILGDADCISNGEIAMNRRNVPAANYNLLMSAFCWMSDDEVPIDVRRESPPDKKIFLGTTGMKITKWGFMAALPFSMFIVYLLIWIRRRSR
jgi:ABC-2 type transport system permease protein